MTLFPQPAGPGAMAGAGLGINPEMRAVITANDGKQPWERWGLLELNNNLLIRCIKVRPSRRGLTC